MGWTVHCETLKKSSDCHFFFCKKWRKASFNLPLNPFSSADSGYPKIWFRVPDPLYVFRAFIFRVLDCGMKNRCHDIILDKYLNTIYNMVVIKIMQYFFCFDEQRTAYSSDTYYKKIHLHMYYCIHKDYGYSVILFVQSL